MGMISNFVFTNIQGLLSQAILMFALENSSKLHILLKSYKEWTPSEIFGANTIMLWSDFFYRTCGTIKIPQTF